MMKKKMKKMIALALSTVMLAGLGSGLTVNAAGPNSIVKVGDRNKTTYVGGSLDLEVKEGYAVKDSQLKWTIKDTSVLRFEDNDRYGDDVEVIGLKVGTSKVTCQNLNTGIVVSYNVTVSNKTGTIKRVGSGTRSIYVGDELELEVVKSGKIYDSNLKWSIVDTSILRFEDNDRYGDDIEVIALKAGTTKVKCKNLLTGKSAVYTVTVKNVPVSYTISRVGSATRTEELDDDFELKVKKSSALKASQIKWTIANTSILRFEDGDNYGTEVELETLRLGTTTVTAHNLQTGDKITYTVTVVPEYDD